MSKVTVGLLGAGLLSIFATAVATGATNPSAATSPSGDAKTILGELLSIDTTYEKGTAAAVDALRTRFLAAGFPEASLVVVANPANPTQSNLVVTLKGHGKGKPLLYLCHLDVVAAKPEDLSLIHI